MMLPLLSMPQGAEWLVILAIVILVFGAAKLPALAKSSGQALRIFKSETKDLRDDKLDTTPEGPRGELGTPAPGESTTEVRHEVHHEVRRDADPSVAEPRPEHRPEHNG